MKINHTNKDLQTPISRWQLLRFHMIDYGPHFSRHVRRSQSQIRHVVSDQHHCNRMPEPMSQPTMVNGDGGVTKRARELGSQIVSSVMQDHALEDNWPDRNEKVRPPPRHHAPKVLRE